MWGQEQVLIIVRTECLELLGKRQTQQARVATGSMAGIMGSAFSDHRMSTSKRIRGCQLKPMNPDEGGLARRKEAIVVGGYEGSDLVAGVQKCCRECWELILQVEGKAGSRIAGFGRCVSRFERLELPML